MIFLKSVVLKYSMWRLLSLTSQGDVSLSYFPVIQLSLLKHPDDKEFLCALE